MHYKIYNTEYIYITNGLRFSLPKKFVLGT